MAASSPFLSTFTSPQTAFFSPKSSFSRPNLPLPSNVRMVPAVTLATASQPNSAARTPKGIMKPYPVTPEMQAIVGVPEIARTQALKEIWAYIKARNLQDPENKKFINCDEKLKKIFAGKDRIGMLEIAGLISPHFIK